MNKYKLKNIFLKVGAKRMCRYICIQNLITNYEPEGSR